MNYSLDEILDKQCEKLSNLKTTTTYIESKDVTKEELLNMYRTVSQLYDGIRFTKKKLDKNKIEDQNNQCKVLLALIDQLNKQIIHMEQNVLTELIHDYTKNVENSSATNI